MSAAFDASFGANYTASASTKTISAGSTLTVGASATRLYVLITLGNSGAVNAPAITAVTWDNGATNQAGALVTNTVATDIASICRLRSEIWEVTSPTSGNKALKVDLAATCSDIFISAVSWTGAANAAHGTNGSSAGGSTKPTLTVTSATNDFVMGLWASDNNITATAATTTNTQIWIDNASGSVSGGAGNRATGASSVTVSLTDASLEWCGSACHVVSAAASGPPVGELIEVRQSIIRASYW